MKETGEQSMHSRSIRKKTAVMLLTAAVALNALGIPAYARESETVVRVAYFDMGQYYQKDAYGNITSYDCDYLSKLEEYSSLRFEYVDCGTWNNALSMLEGNDVDLVGTVQWTEEREKQYEYCLKDYGYTVGGLVAKSDSDIQFEDYEALGRSIIGCTDNYIRRPELDALLAEHHISQEIRCYSEQRELEEALNSGEIDVAALNSHTLPADIKYIERFTFAPLYFISRKGNTALTDTIDDAIIHLNLEDPGFDDNLMKKYFANLLGSPLSKAEEDLIAEGKTYTVYFDGTTKPLVWYDESAGEMKGALVEICKQITEISGLKLEVVNDSEIYKAQSGSIFSPKYYNSKVSVGDASKITDSLIDEPFNIYGCTGSDNSGNSPKTVGIVGTRPSFSEYINEKYPDYTVKTYDSPAECLKNLDNGEVDYVFLDRRVAQSLIVSLNLNTIVEIPNDTLTIGMVIRFSDENAELLTSIINKTLYSVNYDEVNDIFLQFALSTAPEVTFSSLIEDNLPLAVCLIIVLILIVLAVTVVLTYAHVMKKQRDHIEKADRDRSEFFARISHDMRTLMNGIIGMAELSNGEKDIAVLQDNIVKIRESGKYLLSLINDTLDFQRAENGKLELKYEAYPADKALNSVTGMIRQAAVAKGVDFRVVADGVNMGATVMIDPVRIKQIFVNLLNNAVKFTNPGGKVLFEIKTLSREKDISHMVISVTDTGIGMSKDFIEKNLYQPYSQEMNSASSENTGSGLGLSIAKNLVEQMGGHMEVESELGKGTRFTVYLDFRLACTVTDEGDKAEKARGVGELNGKKILLVEDHPLNAEIARRALGKFGCEVTWAQDGQKGTEAFLASEPYYFDAVLMDIRMPNMDGIEATKNIRRLEREDAGKIPVIAMSANAYSEDIKACYSAGMNGHISKPIDMQLLYRTLADCIHK